MTWSHGVIISGTLKADAGGKLLHTFPHPALIFTRASGREAREVREAKEAREDCVFRNPTGSGGSVAHGIGAIVAAGARMR
jgi:hypothetical protein